MSDLEIVLRLVWQDEGDGSWREAHVSVTIVEIGEAILASYRQELKRQELKGEEDMTRDEYAAQGYDFNDLRTIMPALHCVLDGYMNRREEGILREFVLDGLVKDANNYERQTCAYAMVTALIVIERKFIPDNDFERDLILEVLVELGPAGIPTLEHRYQKIWLEALGRREMDRIIKLGAALDSVNVALVNLLGRPKK